MQLRFRRLQDDDMGMVMRWRTLPEVSQYMYSDFEPDLERQRAWLARIRADSSRGDWIIQVDGEDVGLVSVVNIDRLHLRCEWAYYLASPSVRGKGIGRSVELSVLDFVFEELGLNKLCCEVFADNELVIRIHEKYGSVVEGRRRQHVRKQGRFRDIVEMGILREDWERAVRGQFEYAAATIEPVEGLA